MGIERQKLTTYVSRHTMAMTLQSNKVPREVISQVMGHSNLETTNVYLDSFETSVVDEVQNSFKNNENRNGYASKQLNRKVS